MTLWGQQQTTVPHHGQQGVEETSLKMPEYISGQRRSLWIIVISACTATPKQMELDLQPAAAVVLNDNGEVKLIVSVT